MHLHSFIVKLYRQTFIQLPKTDLYAVFVRVILLETALDFLNLAPKFSVKIAQSFC